MLSFRAAVLLTAMGFVFLHLSKGNEDTSSPGMAVEPQIPSTGVHLLDLRQRHVSPATQLQADQAQMFIKYVKDRLPVEKRASFYAECLTRATANPYCPYLGYEKIVEEDAEVIESAILDDSGTPSSTVKDRIREADPEAFFAVKRRDLYRAFKRTQDWEELAPLVEATLKMHRCPPVVLTTALGLKTEEFLPEPRFREKAIKLYQKIDQCAAPGPHPELELARFRLGLLHIWEDRCDLAKPIFGKLSEVEGSRFESRALYWMAWCEKQTGNNIKFSILKNKLIKASPLGYHGISLTHGKQSPVIGWMYSANPTVLLKSERRSDLNPLVQEIESLSASRHSHLAFELLNWVEPHLKNVEPSFKLYLAWLAARSGHALFQFRVLSGAFREDPTLITQDTLKLFYPLKQFQAMARHQNQIDPYFVAAIIRQESGFNERARSRAGAMGLMQLMPRTARRLLNVSRGQLLNPERNIEVGVRYLSYLMRRFEWDAELVLAAYNAGPENVQDWVRRYPVSNRMLFLDLIPFSETREYVALIGRNYYWYLNLYASEMLDLKRSPGSGDRQIATGKKQMTFNALNSL